MGAVRDQGAYAVGAELFAHHDEGFELGLAAVVAGIGQLTPTARTAPARS
ncbi:hypothetical protein ABZ532_07740 [Streptomyces sp. NPDC019396]